MQKCNPSNVFGLSAARRERVASTDACKNCIGSNRRSYLTDGHYVWATSGHGWPTGAYPERRRAQKRRFLLRLSNANGTPKSFLIKRRDDDTNFWRADVAIIKVASSSNGLIENDRVPIQERKVEYLRDGLLKNDKVSKPPQRCEHFFLLLLPAPQKSNEKRWEGVQKVEDSKNSEN